MTAGHLRRLAHRATGVVMPGALLPRVPSLFEPVGAGGPPPAGEFDPSTGSPGAQPAPLTPTPTGTAHAHAVVAQVHPTEAGEPVAPHPAGPEHGQAAGRSERARSPAAALRAPNGAEGRSAPGPHVPAGPVRRPAPASPAGERGRWPDGATPNGRVPVTAKSPGRDGGSPSAARRVLPSPEPRAASPADVVAAASPAPDAAAPDAALLDTSAPDAAAPHAAVPHAAVPQAAVPDIALPDGWRQGASARGLPLGLPSLPARAPTVPVTTARPHRGAGREETTVVQIRIGSIEVRAAAPATPAEPPAAGRGEVPEPAVSLDRYLEERARR